MTNVAVNIARDNTARTFGSACIVLPPPEKPGQLLNAQQLITIVNVNTGQKPMHATKTTEPIAAFS